MKAKKMREMIEKVLSKYPKLYSQTAVDLLLLTFAVESDGGKYRKQLAGGPAKGLFQMEPATFRWLQEVYGEEYEFADRHSNDLKTDDELAILTARLRYWVVPISLPLDTPKDLAGYWKRHYNTYKGAGTISKCLEKYEKYVLAELEEEEKTNEN